MVDVCIDILKFLIPILLTIWTVTHVAPQFSGDSTFVLVLDFVLFLLLVSTILFRAKKVKGYVSKFKEEQEKIATAYLDSKKMVEKIQQAELDSIRENGVALNKYFKSLQGDSGP